MRIVLRKPEWPNKVFHPARVRRGVAKLLSARRKAAAKNTPEPRRGVSRRIPVALPGECRTAEQIKQLMYDPEMPVNIYELGLIYEVHVEEAGSVSIRMTLTAPNCPVAGSLPPEVESKVKAVPGVTGVKLDLVFDPPWTKNKMSEAAKLELGIEDVIQIARISHR